MLAFFDDAGEQRGFAHHASPLPASGLPASFQPAARLQAAHAPAVAHGVHGHFPLDGHLLGPHFSDPPPATVEAPQLQYQLLPGEDASHVVVRVTAAASGAAGASFVECVDLSGLPPGVTADQASFRPTGQPGQVTHDFVLTLPAGVDTNFQLGVTAYAHSATGDAEAQASVSAPITLDFNANEVHTTFTADSQSMWGQGPAFQIHDQQLLGIDTGQVSSAVSENGFVAEADGHLRTGLQSTLDINGGSVCASLPYDIDVATSYNHSTDVLQISSQATLKPGGGFETESPNGSFDLSFVFDFLLHAKIVAELGSLPDLTLFDNTVQVGPANITLAHADSSGAVTQVPLFGATLTAQWPQVNTSSTPDGGNTFEASGSDNVARLDADVDSMVTRLLGIANPFDITVGLSGDLGSISANLQLLDLDLKAALDLEQHFSMAVQGLPGVLTLEDGTSQAFTFGCDVVLDNASVHDANHDGKVDFQLALDPSVCFTNDTELGLDATASLDLVKASANWSFPIFGSGSTSVGPAFHTESTTPVGTVGLFDQTFGLDFNAQTLTFSA